jgi:hypothetical protein
MGKLYFVFFFCVKSLFCGLVRCVTSLDLQIVKSSNFVVKGLLKIVHRFNERRNSRENNSRTTNKTATTLKSGEKPNESQNEYQPENKSEEKCCSVGKSSETSESI